MAVPQELNGKYFYHFTHVKNLESILQNGFLSTNEKIKLGIKHTDTSNLEYIMSLIKQVYQAI